METSFADDFRRLYCLMADGLLMATSIYDIYHLFKLIETGSMIS